MRAAIARLVCFCQGHELEVYRYPRLQLHCRRCHDPWSDTVRDKLNRWRRQRKLPKVERSDELPF